MINMSAVIAAQIARQNLERHRKEQERKKEQEKRKGK